MAERERILPSRSLQDNIQNGNDEWINKMNIHTTEYCAQLLSCVQFFAPGGGVVVAGGGEPKSVACQTFLCMGFLRQEMEWVAISFSKGSS